MYRRQLLVGLAGWAVGSGRLAALAAGNRRVVVMGHVDHGKTTLTAAITRVLSLRGMAQEHSYEELARGAPRREGDASFSCVNVDFQSKGLAYRASDCPQHSDYLTGLVSGGLRIDACVLVVSAIDGPMPQTKEHLALLHEMGVQNLVVFLNKVDRADDPDLLALVEAEVADLLTHYGYDAQSTTMIRGSALAASKVASSEAPDAQCIWQLMGALGHFKRRAAPTKRSRRTRIVGVVLPLAAAGDGPSFEGYGPVLRIGKAKTTGTITFARGNTSKDHGALPVEIQLADQGLVCDVGSHFTVLNGDRPVALGLVTGVR